MSGCPVILDCDPGVDDALALFLALKSGKLEVAGIVTVGGNVPVAQVTRNAGFLLTLLGRPDVPVCSGLQAPLGDNAEGEEVHGADGLAGLNPRALERSEAEDPGVAVDRMIQFYDSLDRVDVIATGPLTNLAALLRRCPAIGNKIGRLVIMGGALEVEGNVTPYAEFNFFADPEAARVVLSCRIPILLVSLDVTHGCLLTPELVNRLSREGRFEEALHRLVEHYCGYYMESRHFAGCPLHDPLAVGAVIDSSFVQVREASLAVEKSGPRKGQVRAVGKRGSVEVCSGVDSERFLDYFVEVMNRPLQGR